MDYKPRDLFLSAVDIFAIFFPGAIMMYLRLDFVSMVFNNVFHISPNGAEFWIAFIVGSYLMGQILMASAVIFNKVESNYQSKIFWNESIYRYVKKNIPQEKDEEVGRSKCFYRAYSYIRLNSANALAEIEKQSADYKLFRSLTLVSTVECIVSLLLGQWQRAIIALAFFIFCFWRFVYLRSQTQMLAFEFFYLLNLQENKKKPNPKTAT